MTLRVACFGLGWVARNGWIPSIRANAELELTLGVDPSEQVRREVNAWMPDVELVGQIAPELVPADLAVIAVPNHLHVSVAAGLLARGIDCLIEKPVCLRSSEVAELASAARSGGAAAFSSAVARYRGDVRILRELVEKGEIGALRHVEVSWVRSRGVPGSGGWLTHREHAGGGVLADLGWHVIDVALDLLGYPAVQAALSIGSSDHLHDAEFSNGWREDRCKSELSRDVEDTATGFCVLEGGLGLSLRLGWASHEPRDETTLTVHGSEGRARLRTTFGFSPNRVRQPRLMLMRRGIASWVPLPSEPIGREFCAQLRELVHERSREGFRSRGLQEISRTAGAIEALYASMRSVGSELPGPAQARA